MKCPGLTSANNLIMDKLQSLISVDGPGQVQLLQSLPAISTFVSQATDDVASQVSSGIAEFLQLGSSSHAGASTTSTNQVQNVGSIPSWLMRSATANKQSPCPLPPMAEFHPAARAVGGLRVLGGLSGLSNTTDLIPASKVMHHQPTSTNIIPKVSNASLGNARPTECVTAAKLPTPLQKHGILQPTQLSQVPMTGATSLSSSQDMFQIDHSQQSRTQHMPVHSGGNGDVSMPLTTGQQQPRTSSVTSSFPVSLESSMPVQVSLPTSTEALVISDSSLDHQYTSTFPNLNVDNDLLPNNGHGLCSQLELIQNELDTLYSESAGVDSTSDNGADSNHQMELACLIDLATTSMESDSQQMTALPKAAPAIPMEALPRPVRPPSPVAPQDADVSLFVEEILCYKCKFCAYVSLYKNQAISHAKNSHASRLAALNISIVPSNPKSNSMSKGTATTAPNNKRNRKPPSRQSTSNRKLPTSSSVRPTCNSSIANLNTGDRFLPMSEDDSLLHNRFLCGKCKKGYPTLEDCRRHMSTEHQIRSSRVRLERITWSQPSGTITRKQSTTVNLDQLNKSSLEPLLTGTLSREANQPVRSAEQRPQKSTSLSIDRVQNCQLTTSETTAPSQLERLVLDPGESLNMGQNKPVLKTLSTDEISFAQRAWRKKVNREQGTYICESKGCNVRFRALNNLEYHRKCHISDSTAFSCPDCGSRSEHWSSMAGHVWRQHLIDLELHACDQCSFRTYSLSKLENLHKRIHYDERPYICDICSKGFKTSKQLRNHKVIHLDKRRQRQFRSGECEVCHRRFSDKRMLRLHMDTVHRKLRPFTCDYCGYSTSSRTTLKMHIRQHTGEKPFACDMCDYRTADHNSLRRHKMRHSGEKPYKCPYCPYACIQSSTFKTHLKNKHPDQNEGLMFTCSFCTFRTIKRDNYVTHMCDHKQDSLTIMESKCDASGDTVSSLVLSDTTRQDDIIKRHLQDVPPTTRSTEASTVAGTCSMQDGNLLDGTLMAAQYMLSTLDDLGQRFIQQVVSKV